MNKFKTTETPEETIPQKDTPKVVKSLSSIFSGSFLSKNNVISYLPYMLFVTVIGILYIANGYYAEKTVRSLYKTTSDLKELRSEYITIKSDLNYLSKQSQVALATESLGIKESVIPPSKIVVTKKEFEQIITK
ncbi:MAG: FtsL-like putative cell division protein [Flavobacteriales bacterium]